MFQPIHKFSELHTFSSRSGLERKRPVIGWSQDWVRSQIPHLSGCYSWEIGPGWRWRLCYEHLSLLTERCNVNTWTCFLEKCLQVINYIINLIFKWLEGIFFKQLLSNTHAKVKLILNANQIIWPGFIRGHFKWCTRCHYVLQWH